MPLIIIKESQKFSGCQPKNMKKTLIFISLIVFFSVLISFCPKEAVSAQELTNEQFLDKKVKAFLDRRQGSWVDMNVPASDGKILYDIILILFFVMPIRSGIKIILSISTRNSKQAGSTPPIIFLINDGAGEG